jgi:Lrp/AsnC family transcriptional regulator, regulator for asnA, asnC and gidA
VLLREPFERAKQRRACHLTLSSPRSWTVRDCAFRPEKSSSLTQCAAKWYESHALRSSEAQPLRVAPADPGRGAVTPARRVDDLDRKIIEALQANGRESFRRIAAGLGVSEATVRARYARLTSEGVLQVVAVTNPLGLGFDQALVGIKTTGAPSEIADEISRWPEADYVVVTAGQFDLVVEVVAADRRELLELTNRMRALPGVSTTETFFYLEMWKQLYDWGTRK